MSTQAFRTAATPPNKNKVARTVSSPQLTQKAVPELQVMERIRTFNARRGGGRAIDFEGASENSHNNIVVSQTTQKKPSAPVNMDRRTLEQKYVELQAKLQDTEAFWKDDSRHKDKRISELERSNKSLADSNSFLNIKLRMLEQELVDKQEEMNQLKQQHRQAALKWSAKLY